VAHQHELAGATSCASDHWRRVPGAERLKRRPPSGCRAAPPVPNSRTLTHLGLVRSFMDVRKVALQWPVLKQLTGPGQAGSRRSCDVAPLARAHAAHRARRQGGQERLPVLRGGCAQNVYVKDGEVIQIEGNPDSPVSRGRLCPKGPRAKSSSRVRLASTRSATGGRMAPSGKTSTSTPPWTCWPTG
jgi:hypothetical protein